MTASGGEIKDVQEKLRMLTEEVVSQHLNN